MAHLFVEINGFSSSNFDFRYICHIVVMDATQASAFCLRIKKKSMKGNRELGNYWVLTIKITYLEYIYIKDVSQKEK